LPEAVAEKERTTMSDFLAIDLEPHRICGIEASVERGSVKIRKSFSIEVPESISVDDPHGLGEWLKGELRRERASASQVCISGSCPVPVGGEVVDSAGPVDARFPSAAAP
jgi:hypothetical protein